MAASLLVMALFSGLVKSVPTLSSRSSDPLNPMPSIQPLGRTTSNLPNIFRDGGGGGRIGGKDFLIFSDGIYTSDGRVPASDNSLANWANFTSNSIACSNCDGRGVTSLQDFGTAAKGPYQQVPFFYRGGEDDHKTAVWPNQGIATLCGGDCGVSFPVVVNRTETDASKMDLYNTGIGISLTGYGPVVTRPTQALFRRGEPLFGSFATLVGIDGYLYVFATITKTTKASGGLKMARVPQGSWSDRSQYQFWSGSAWTAAVPAYDDGGEANILTWSEDGFGTQYGPGTGDLFYSQHYGRYILMFTSDNPALDPNGKFDPGWISCSMGNWGRLLTVFLWDSLSFT
jgi:hypothetical protein